MNKLIMLIIVSLIFIPTTAGYASDKGLKLSIMTMIRAAEVKYSLPHSLLAALINVESAGNHRAVNRDDGNRKAKEKGVVIKSHGLVQIQLGTARLIQKTKSKASGIRLEKKDLITTKQLMNPETNIEYGAMYLKWLLTNHDNDISWALTCYNAGPYSRLCENKIYYGRYVGKILNEWIRLKSQQ